MDWYVEVLNDAVLEALQALPDDMRAKIDRIVELIEMFGLHHVHEPYIKHLQNKLWEMRVKGKDGIARAIYVTAHKRRVVILHAFRKKSQKTPRRAIQTALARLREIDQ